MQRVNNLNKQVEKKTNEVATSLHKYYTDLMDC